MSEERDVFAALGHIEDGDWDHWLHRLRGAIILRQKTAEYQATLIAGKEDVP